jgi:PIN domain nuclease of toxin-antitoxin system
MIYLDTHVVVWVYAFAAERLSGRALELIEHSSRVLISPMVLLELEFLQETGKVAAPPGIIHEYLSDRIGLEICGKDFRKVVRNAMRHTWTRDPFDRLITAQAALENDVLVTKDRLIRDNYPRAVW